MTRQTIIPKSFNLKSLLPGGSKNKDKVAQIESGVTLDPKVEEEKVSILNHLFKYIFIYK